MLSSIEKYIFEHFDVLNSNTDSIGSSKVMKV